MTYDLCFFFLSMAGCMTWRYIFRKLLILLRDLYKIFRKKRSLEEHNIFSSDKIKITVNAIVKNLGNQTNNKISPYPLFRYSVKSPPPPTPTVNEGKGRIWEKTELTAMSWENPRDWVPSPPPPTHPPPSPIPLLSPSSYEHDFVFELKKVAG